MAESATVHSLPGARAASPLPADTSSPSPPRGLSREARSVWGELVGQVERVAPGWLKSVDSIALGYACEDAALAAAALKAMRVRGGWYAVLHVDDGHQGRVAKHPAFQVYRDASRSFMERLGVLGLSPRARAQLDVGSPVGDDGDDDEGVFS